MKKIFMNMLRSLFRWGALYIIVGIFILVFYWEESLRISSNEHILLGIGVLLGFGYMMNRWILNHETDLIAPELQEKWHAQNAHRHCAEDNNHSEKGK